jgi:hypothetical protein
METHPNPPCEGGDSGIAVFKLQLSTERVRMFFIVILIYFINSPDSESPLLGRGKGEAVI